MRTKRRVVVVLACGMLAAGLGVPAVAGAVQHQNANMYALWSWGGSGFWNVDQHVRVDAKAKATYWAEQFFWTGASYGAAMGLQTNGNPVGGGVGDTAIFSAWNANAARGGNCEPFSGEGVGYKCAIAYPIVPGRLYRLRIWRQESDTGGQWWGAWVKDEATGVDTSIGGIRVPSANTTISTTQNFVEYFGPQVACGQVPRSIGIFTQPAANSQGGGLYQYGSTYASGTTASCVTGSRAAYTSGGLRGVRIVHGGRVPQATRVVFTHGFEQDGSNGCGGTWGDMLGAFRALNWTNQLTVAKYYADDTNCSTTAYGSVANTNIGSYGSHNTWYPSGHVERNGAIVGHSTDARIRHLSYHWAWMVYNRFTLNGYPIKAVGHSMGGLIMRAAIKEVQAGNPDFPPRLVIEDTVTLGTPHTGTSTANVCALTHEQCRDLRPDSDFLNDLSANGQNPQADGGTEWSTFGAGDDDTVTDGSATNMTAADEVVFASGQGIEHGEYMHQKTGTSLGATDAEVDISHYGTFCSGLPFTLWPVALTSTALIEPTDPCTGGGS